MCAELCSSASHRNARLAQSQFSEVTSLLLYSYTYVVLLVSLGKAKPSGPTSTGAKSRQSTLSEPCEIARYEKVQPYIDTMCACKTSILRGGRELKRQRMWRRICIATKRQPPRKLTNKGIQWRPLMLPNQEPNRPHAPCTPYHLPVCTTP